MTERANSQSTQKKNPLGPTGITVASNIKRLRETQNLKYADLARLLESKGRTIPTLGLRKIESFERRVDADDLVALAVALDVSPATLLLPPSETGTDEVQLTGTTHTVSARNAWDFLIAAQPLRPYSQSVQAVLGWSFKVRPAWLVAEEEEARVRNMSRPATDFL